MSGSKRSRDDKVNKNNKNDVDEDTTTEDPQVVEVTLRHASLSRTSPDVGAANELQKESLRLLSILLGKQNNGNPTEILQALSSVQTRWKTWIACYGLVRRGRVDIDKGEVVRVWGSSGVVERVIREVKW